MMKVIRSR